MNVTFPIRQDFTEFYDQPYDGEHARVIDPSVPELMMSLQNYKKTIGKNDVLFRLDVFSDVVYTFCNDQIKTVEQIQQNIKAEKNEPWEKDYAEFCSNVVSDFYDPEEYPYTLGQYKKMCGEFNWTFDKM